MFLPCCWNKLYLLIYIHCKLNNETKYINGQLPFQKRVVEDSGNLPRNFVSTTVKNFLQPSQPNVNYILYKRAQSHPIFCKILSYKYLYSLSIVYGAATRKRLFLSVLDRFLSVFGCISPSKIDSIVQKFRFSIVRNFYFFFTIQSVCASQ